MRCDQKISNIKCAAAFQLIIIAASPSSQLGDTERFPFARIIPLGRLLRSNRIESNRIQSVVVSIIKMHRALRSAARSFGIFGGAAAALALATTTTISSSQKSSPPTISSSQESSPPKESPLEPTPSPAHTPTHDHTPTHEETPLRTSIIATSLAMNALGINQGKSGNVSARMRTAHGDCFLITPSGVPYDELDPSMVVRMSVETGQIVRQENEPKLKPSTEWRMHRDIYAAKPDAKAVVHAHPTFSTALACRRQSIPKFHYMVAVAGGDRIECTRDYFLFGSEALSGSMMDALGDGRRACLLANHGMICYDSSLRKALDLAVEVETLAMQYWHASSGGSAAPVVELTDAEMNEVLAAIKSYGRQ